MIAGDRSFTFVTFIHYSTGFYILHIINFKKKTINKTTMVLQQYCNRHLKLFI